MSEIAAKRVFVASLVFLVAAVGFVYGLAVERYQIWPYATLQGAIDVAKQVAAYGEPIPPGRRVAAPQNASREMFTVHDRDRMSDGYYVFVGWDDAAGLYAAWLHDARGRRLHTWLFDYDALDPDGPWNGEDHPHPFHVLPDGSVLVAFDSGDIMTRLDACGEPLWIKHGIYHHSLSRGDDGTFWIWRGDGTPYGYYHYIQNFDPATGDTISELGLIEDIIEPAGAQSAVFVVRPDFPFVRFERDPVFRAANDFFHPNDVDILSAELAPLFPMFEAGDLLLSFRTLDLVAVVGQRTGEIKWWSRSGWKGQHDPDFTSDGKISVFANNTDRGRSEIIKIDPASRELTNELFHGDARFYTAFMGKHQYLPNGNLLLVLPGEGRILEVTADGDNVMEFNNIVEGYPQYNDHVENGVWVPSDYFETFPACAGR